MSDETEIIQCAYEAVISMLLDRITGLTRQNMKLEARVGELTEQAEIQEMAQDKNVSLQGIHN